MQMLYNSDSYVVVQFDLSDERVPAHVQRKGGFEIVDKLARREIYIEGPVAAGFLQGVEALVQTESGPEDFDEFIGRYTLLAQQPVTVH